MSVKDWMLDRVSKNPMITHGDLWRDFCFTNFTKSDKLFYKSIKELKESESIVAITKDFQTSYDLGTQLKRDNNINKILNNE